MPDDATPPRLRSAETPEEWERVIRAAARAQTIVPGAVLVGGTAAAIHAGHRFSAYRWIADRWRSWDEVRDVSLRLGALLERARNLEGDAETDHGPNETLQS